MNTIIVTEGAWSLRTLYLSANTPSKRALVGYMLKTRRADDMVYGGALYLLRDIETCKGIYYLKPECEMHKAKQIIHITEMALAGQYNRFALSKREIRKILKHMKKGR